MQRCGPSGRTEPVTRDGSDGWRRRRPLELTRRAMPAPEARPQSIDRGVCRSLHAADRKPQTPAGFHPKTYARAPVNPTEVVHDRSRMADSHSTSGTLKRKYALLFFIRCRLVDLNVARFKELANVVDVIPVVTAIPEQGERNR